MFKLMNVGALLVAKVALGALWDIAAPEATCLAKAAFAVTLAGQLPFLEVGHWLGVSGGSVYQRGSRIQRRPSMSGWGQTRRFDGPAKCPVSIR
jgi:hypothetical protein